MNGSLKISNVVRGREAHIRAAMVCAIVIGMSMMSY